MRRHPEFRTHDRPRLEAVTKYRRFRHGEAVAYGMLAAADIAVGTRNARWRGLRAAAGLITQLGPLPAVADLSDRTGARRSWTG